MPTARTDLFDDDAIAVAKAAKALSHPARIEILRVLASRNACICGEIVDELPLAQSTVSQHLKALKEAGLIEGTIEGAAVCYCINTGALKKAIASISVAMDELVKGGSCC